MKTKLFFTILSIILLLPGSFAKEVRLDDARKVAVNLYFERMNQYEEGIAYDQVQIINTFVRKENGLPVYYAFDISNGGFVIVSGDDAYTPVIGYSFHEEFPKDNVAHVYASFMQGYADMIGHIREKDIQADEATSAEWDHLLTSNPGNLNTMKDNRDVDPLADHITWDQNNPYNQLCPPDPAGPGGHCLAGCVATAMSMIMYYYRYPVNGTNDHCYTPDPQYGELCVDFEETFYQWDGMQNSIDNYNPVPIAELQYHCGVSVNMNYGPAGSGSQSAMVPNRLAYFWRYNDAHYKEKSNFSQQGWINLLKTDLDQSRPLYYSGCSTSGCHAFLCDGYQGDEFHFNFGWSGYSNGFYTLNNVGGYYISQACVHNFYPSDPDYPYHATGADTIYQPSGSFTDGSGPIDNYLDNQNASWLIDPQTPEDSITNITVSFTEFDLASGDYLRAYDGATDADPLLGEFTGSTLPLNILSTGNQMLITFETDGSGTGKGFFAEFETTAPQWCLGMTELTDVSGTFDDGSGNFYYNNGATCMWKIEPEFANQITIYFNEFDTEPDKDKLEIYDGTTSVGVFSGPDLPDPIEITSGSAFLTWSTNSSINGPGWEIYYEIDNVGVSENNPFENLAVYPNPAREELNISFSINNTQSIHVKLMTMTGNAVYEEHYDAFTGIFDHHIDLGEMAKGVYILSLSGEQGIQTKKVVIQ
ncbi:MAG: C10 family peptidase [Bacteroidales bacterium]